MGFIQEKVWSIVYKNFAKMKMESNQDNLQFNYNNMTCWASKSQFYKNHTYLASNGFPRQNNNKNNIKYCTKYMK